MTFDEINKQENFSAQAAGTITLGNDRVVNRFGYGAMRLGSGVWGKAANPSDAKTVLRRAVDLGINFIDTAAFYGPGEANKLIQEALYPYPEGLVIATKIGPRRGEGPRLYADMRPERLRLACEENLRQLRLEQLPLVHYRYMENTDVSFVEAVGTLAELQREGIIRHIGISNVTLAQLREAQSVASIVSVQNLYNLAHRQDEDLLEACTKDQIAFIPYFPLAMGQIGQQANSLAVLTQRYSATPHQIALAWLLAHSPVMLPIPGTSSLTHLEENIASVAIHLTDEDMLALEG